LIDPMKVDPLTEPRAAEVGPSEFTQFLKSGGGEAPTLASTPAPWPAQTSPSTTAGAQPPPPDVTSPVVAWGTPIAPAVPPVAGLPQPPVPAAVPPPIPLVPPAKSFEPGEFTRFLSQTTGEQLRPKTSSPADTSASVVTTSGPASPAREPGEFTRFFSATGASPTPSMAANPIPPGAIAGGPSGRVVDKGGTPPLTSPAVTPPSVQTPSSPGPTASLNSPPPLGGRPGQGEFTKFFSGGEMSAAMPSSAMPAALSDRVVNKGAPPLPGTPLNPDSDELTKRFQAPPQTPSESLFDSEELSWGKDSLGAGASKPPSYPAQGPGEFTKAMQSPLAAESFRAPRVAPAKQPPGEFTRMFQGGGLQQDPTPPRPDPRPAEPQAFPWKPSQSAGEYTKIFESAQSREDQYSPAPVMPIHSGSTDLFGNKPAPRAAPLAAGPSDYTQMMNAASAPKPVATVPTAPKALESKPTPSKGSAKPLIIIAGILVFLAIVLVVVILVRR
jgi:hypothetical protein